MSAAEVGPPPAGGDVVGRARTVLGVRFRMQGRAPQEGFDCIGLVGFAIRASLADLPPDYGARGGDLERLRSELTRQGLVRIDDGQPRAGDVALFVPGPGQLHLGIVTEAGLIHADAGLRKVVERPFPMPWPLLEAWRVRTPTRKT
jgi:cell wall-associated NlpC family hydrolase